MIYEYERCVPAVEGPQLYQRILLAQLDHLVELQYKHYGSYAYTIHIAGLKIELKVLRIQQAYHILVTIPYTAFCLLK